MNPGPDEGEGVTSNSAERRSQDHKNSSGQREVTYGRVEGSPARNNVASRVSIWRPRPPIIMANGSNLTDMSVRERIPAFMPNDPCHTRAFKMPDMSEGMIE